MGALQLYQVAFFWPTSVIEEQPYINHCIVGTPFINMCYQVHVIIVVYRGHRVAVSVFLSRCIPRLDHRVAVAVFSRSASGWGVELLRRRAAPENT